MDKRTIKDLKKFSWISQLAMNTLVTIVLGVGLGYLLDYLCNTWYFIIICSLVFLFLAIINFIYQLYKIGNR